MSNVSLQQHIYFDASNGYPQDPFLDTLIRGESETEYTYFESRKGLSMRSTNALYGVV